MKKIAPLVFAFLLPCFVVPVTAEELVFIGRGDKNIHVGKLDTSTGALTDVRQAAELPAPSFICIAPNHHFLYAVSEGRTAEKSGISAFAIGPDGALTLLNRQPSGGAGPCYVAVDPEGKCVLAANYASGSMVVFPLQSDGSLGARSTFIQDHGSSGVNPGRQEGPHAHCALTDPGDHYAFDCDLGLDQVLIYKIDPATGILTPNDPPFFSGKPGAGPRHLTFHPNGRFAYLINELDSTIVTLAYDASKGTLAAQQTSALLPEDFKGKSTAAEVAVHPSGKFVYGSNRGHDSITVFSCDPETGHLTLVEHHSSGGKTPRNFEIDPTGGFLLAANQSGEIVVFRIDPATGKLHETGSVVHVPIPMCIQCIPEP
jgi:6-phosphogluconolactonase